MKTCMCCDENLSYKLKIAEFKEIAFFIDDITFKWNAKINNNFFAEEKKKKKKKPDNTILWVI